MVEDIKNKAEALLFSSGRKLSAGFIAGLTGAGEKDVETALKELAKDYDSRDSSLMVFQEGSEWKISVREKYASLVRKIVADTELPKSVLETLAVIAWKSPVLQSEIINIRSNKGYEHISELEELGFVTKEKKGRSFQLKITDKFYQYFDVPDKKAFREMIKPKEPEQKKLGSLEVVDSEESTKPSLDGLEIVNLNGDNVEESQDEEQTAVPKGSAGSEESSGEELDSLVKELGGVEDPKEVEDSEDKEENEEEGGEESGEEEKDPEEESGKDSDEDSDGDDSSDSEDKEEDDESGEDDKEGG